MPVSTPGRVPTPSRIFIGDGANRTLVSALRPPGVGTRCRVLVAEDNPVNQMLVVAMLRKLECDADGVVDGQFAIEAVAARWYDLVLMDCEMPRMDGFEATRRIRALPPRTGPRLAIAALTASMQADACARCLEAGMDDFILKPISIAQLARTLARWTSRPEA